MLDGTRDAPRHAAALALRFQHADDVVRCAVAEQLPELFLVIRDAVALDQLHEVGGGIALEPLRRSRQSGAKGTARATR
jgi:hypothetical protein